MDDGVPCALAGGVVQRLEVQHEASGLEDAHEQDEEQRGHDGELDKGLAA